MICAKIRITGKVQGVWFRDYVRKSAHQLDLYGYVKNELDGTVLTEVEGEKHIIESLIDKIKVGSPLSNVEIVEVDWSDFKNKYHSFRIIR